MKYDIFISYRREGGYDTAKHLYDLLTRDGYKVSFDIDTLRSGDFDTQLLQRIDECKDFILIIDKHAFDRTLDSSFNKNNDWLRCELAYALKKDKNIIPVFLSDVKGFPESLPSDISNVVRKNGPEYNRYYFNDFYYRLKKKFLKTQKTSYRIVYFSLLTLISIISILFLCLPSYRETDKTEEVDSTNANYSSIKISEPLTSTVAKRCFIETVKQVPFYTTSLTDSDGYQHIYGMVGRDNDNGYVEKSGSIVPGSIELVHLKSVAGCWQRNNSISVNEQMIYNPSDLDKEYGSEGDGFIFWIMDNSSELYAINEIKYLYFHVERSIYGNAISSTLHNFCLLNLENGIISSLNYLTGDDDAATKNGEFLNFEAPFPVGIKDLLVEKVTVSKVVYRSSEDEISYEDPENYYKKWNLDNPNRLTIFDEKEHGAKNIVKLKPTYYSINPLGDEANDAHIYENDKYKLFVMWRGNVMAYDKIGKQYFLLWSENGVKYMDKYVRIEGEDKISLYYPFSGAWDDAIHFDLSNMTYYIEKLGEDTIASMFPNQEAY